MIYLMSDFCEDYTILSVTYLIKNLFTVFSIIVPIILILSLTITVAKAFFNGSSDAFTKAGRSSFSKIIAAIIIFFVPTILNFFLSFVGAEAEFLACYNNANAEYIAIKKADIEAQKELEKLKREQLAEKKRQEREEWEKNNQSTNSSSINGVIGSVDTSNNSGLVTTSTITYINTSDLAVPLYYSDHNTILKTLGVNSQIATEMHNILFNVSLYVKQNNKLIPRLETAGAYVNKAGYHGKGLAIDLFNLWSYTAKNGKTYMPYSQYGFGAWQSYQKFICEVCDGKEDCEYNINYVIYKRFFEGNGWCWGGNWGIEYYDPMHYEYTGSACYTANKKAITCS